MISDWTYVDNIHIRLISSREPTAAFRLPPLQTKAYSSTAYNSKVKTRSVNNILRADGVGSVEIHFLTIETVKPVEIHIESRSIR